MSPRVAPVRVAPISVAPIGVSPITAERVQGGDELQFLRAQFTDAQLRAIYSTRYNVTQGSGVVSAWDDARGTSGYGAQLAAAATQRPPWDATNLLIGPADGGDDELTTAASSLYDLSGAMSLVFVAAFPDNTANNRYLGAIESSAAQERTLSVLSKNDTGTVKGLAGITAGYASMDSAVAPSTARRLFIVTKNAGTSASIRVPHAAGVTGTPSATGAGDNRLTLFNHFTGAPAANASTASIRAVLVLALDATTVADILAQWAIQFHQAVLTAA